MKAQKRVLIITMTCGEGHNSVSRALSESLLERGIETKIVELFSYSPARIRFENWQCLFTIKHFRKPYDIVWERLNKLKPENRDKLIVHNLVKKALKSLSEEISSYDPCLVISTHPYANAALSSLVKKKMINGNIKSVSVLTDYCVHPYWEAGINVDYVITPLDNTTAELIKRGYESRQIKPLGLPILRKFAEQKDKQSVREKLGIEDKFTLLLLSGGYALDNRLKIIREVLKVRRDVQVLCVCGKNASNKRKIDRFLLKNNIKNVYNFGFVSNLDELMYASDCAFAGGGAVSLTELMYANVPIVIRENMITNEKLNKRFFIESGFAVGMEKLSDCKIILEKLYDNPGILKDIADKQKQENAKNVRSDIAEFLNGLCGS